MEARNRYHRAAVWLGSVAAALLLFGGTALAACTTNCYVCGSWCSQQVIERGTFYRDGNGNWVWFGGMGWGNCPIGSACWQQVGVICTQKCNDCIAAGGCYGGGNGVDTVPRSCTDSTCSVFTGRTRDNLKDTSVCTDFCWCASGSYNCMDTKIADDGLVTTQNYACKCPN